MEKTRARRAGGSRYAGGVRIPLGRLLIEPAEHVAGLDLVHLLRTLDEPDLRPVEVTPLAAVSGLWVVRNGRHRVVRALIAGEPDVEAVDASAQG